MSDLVARLRGKYAVPINDGGGPIDGKKEYLRVFNTLPICHEAADEIERLRAQLADSISRETVIATELERDEAREAAMTMWLGVTDTVHDKALETWPWLGGE